MINYEKIGAKIRYARKFIKNVSQETMAFELNMHQADISNLEKAKRGSGITDLSRLEQITEYLGISLESLLFDHSDNAKENGKRGREMTMEQKIELFKRALSAEALMNGTDDPMAPKAGFQKEYAEVMEKLEPEEYRQWKESYIESEYQKLKDRRKLITVVFRSYGSVTAEQVAQTRVTEFLKMIDQEEEKELIEVRVANEQDLRQFIAETAYDEDYREAFYEDQFD